MCYPSRETSIDQFLQEMVQLLHSNERGARTASDPDWLELNGNPTIPPVQSIRAPPATIALPATKDNMLGITNKNVSRRYLEKLQRDRERNQEVLAECIDNLPITIKQLVYPEKPVNKDAWKFANISTTPSRETKFRVSRNNDFWQESSDKWEPDDSNSQHESITQIQQNRHRANGNGNGRNGVRDSSFHSMSTSEGAFLNKDFVHYPGFQGTSQTFKYKYGKKKTAGSSDNSTKPPPTKFRPKGYGSLYDELEFERRYKKVFDLNKHIHFVHSNFLSGQRLAKRSRLPPIGYIPSVQSDPMDPGDIFAIMSVQKYNHPGDFDKTRQPLSTPGSGLRRSDGSFDRRFIRPRLEVSQSLDTPIGFVPGTVQKTGSSPFDGVNGSNHEITRENLYRLQSLLKEEHVQETPRTHRVKDDQSQTETRKKGNNKRGLDEEKRKSKIHKKPPVKQDSVDIAGSEAPDDMEPFNIRVHVEIRPSKEHEANENKSEDSREDSPAQTNGAVYTTDQTNNNDEHVEQEEKFEEKIVYPTKLDSAFDMDKDNQTNPATKEHVIRPKHITITTNEYGIITKKVQYPQDFLIVNSVATDSREEHTSKTDLIGKVVKQEKDEKSDDELPRK